MRRELRSRAAAAGRLSFSTFFLIYLFAVKQRVGWRRGAVEEFLCCCAEFSSLDSQLPRLLLFSSITAGVMRFPWARSATEAPVSVGNHHRRGASTSPSVFSFSFFFNNRAGEETNIRGSKRGEKRAEMQKQGRETRGKVNGAR